MPDVQEQHLLPGPVRVDPPPAPVTPVPTGHTIKDAVLVILLMAAAAGGGYFARAWEDFKVQQSLTDTAATGDTLTLPPEVLLTVSEPQEVRAETRGRRVIWMSLDKELVLRPFSAKSVYAWASRPGEYRIIAWSAVDGMPTPNAVSIVKVADPVADKTAKK